MRNFLFLFVVVAMLAGCAYQQPRYIIVSAPSIVAVQPQRPAVVPPVSQKETKPERLPVWRPDPTYGLICNLSKTVTIDRLWIDSRPPTAPTLIGLLPEFCQSTYAFFGDHFWYAEGSVELSIYGKVSVGTVRREFYIRSWSYWGGGYAWRIYIGDGDFGR